MKYQVLKESITETMIIRLCSDRIVRILGKPNIVLSKEDLQYNISEYNRLIQGNFYAFIYYSEDDTFTFDAGSIQYDKNNQNSFPKICIAVVIKSFAQKLMANFYLKFKPQHTPFKIFNTLAEAENWCHNIIAEYDKKSK